jgi:hypothetical protein
MATRLGAPANAEAAEAAVVGAAGARAAAAWVAAA